MRVAAHLGRRRPGRRLVPLLAMRKAFAATPVYEGRQCDRRGRGGVCRGDSGRLSRLSRHHRSRVPNFVRCPMCGSNGRRASAATAMRSTTRLYASIRATSNRSNATSISSTAAATCSSIMPTRSSSAGSAVATPAVIARDLRAYRALGITSISCLTFGAYSVLAYPVNLEAFARAHACARIRSRRGARRCRRATSSAMRAGR